MQETCCPCPSLRRPRSRRSTTSPRPLQPPQNPWRATPWTCTAARATASSAGRAGRHGAIPRSAAAPSGCARAARSARRRCCSPRFSTRPNSNRQPAGVLQRSNHWPGRAAGRPRAVFVVLAIRHGDRSAIFEMPGERDADGAAGGWSRPRQPPACAPSARERRAAQGRLLPTTTGDGAALGQLTPTGFAQYGARAHLAARAPLLAALAQPLAQRRRLPERRLPTCDRPTTQDANVGGARLVLPAEPQRAGAGGDGNLRGRGARDDARRRPRPRRRSPGRTAAARRRGATRARRRARPHR